MTPSRAQQLTQMVSEMPSSQLHGLCSRLSRQAMEKDWSSGQEFLWTLAITELEQRRRAEPHPLKRCSCELCFSPFDDPELEYCSEPTDEAGGAE